MPELAAGLVTSCSHVFPFKFISASVFQRLLKTRRSDRAEILRVVVDVIPHNLSEGNVKLMLEEAGTMKTDILSGKFCRSRGHVHIEPLTSMKDSP